MNWQLRTQPSTVTVASRCCIIARMDQNCATLEHTHILIILNNHMLHRHLNNDLKICYKPAFIIYNDQVLVLVVSRFFMEQPFCLAINS